jgi:hypothetical protein
VLLSARVDHCLHGRRELAVWRSRFSLSRGRRTVRRPAPQRRLHSSDSAQFAAWLRIPRSPSQAVLAPAARGRDSWGNSVLVGAIFMISGRTHLVKCFLLLSFRQCQPCGSRFPLTVLKRKIRPAFEKLGIRGIGWHTFCHTVGTLLAEMGEHQLTIRDYLRHSNLSVTNKYLQGRRTRNGRPGQVGRGYFARANARGNNRGSGSCCTLIAPRMSSGQAVSL